MSIFSGWFGTVGTRQLKTIYQAGAFLVDVRSPGEFDSGSVKGAVNIPLENIMSHIASFKSKGSIIVFCRSGNRSRQAKNILEKNGIGNVVNGGSLSNVNKVLNSQQAI